VITIVSGLPRSGTSLMMQMLHAGGMEVLTDRLREPDQDNPRGYFEFEPVKQTRSDSSWLEAAGGKAVKMVYLLLYDLPPGRDYRVLFMKRPLGEVLASQRRMLEREGKPAGDLADPLMEKVFKSHLEKVEAWLGTQENFRVLPVHYHGLLLEPRRSAREVGRFLDRDLDAEAMAGAVDLSLHRQRAEPGRGASHRVA
jgi:hypothetical protein